MPEKKTYEKMSLDQIVRTGNDPCWQAEMLRTGIPSLDYNLGGGLAYGRFIEVFGDFATGKTVLVHLALSANQKAGGTSFLAETEQSFDRDFFIALGGDPAKLRMFDFEYCATVEDVFMSVRKVCETVIDEHNRTGKPSKVVVGYDGLGISSTKHLEETGLDKLDLTKAKVIKAGCSYITQFLARSRVMFIATNQTYELIGQTASRGYTPVTTPGGKGPKFLASQRVEMRFRGGERSSSIEAEAGGRKTQVGRWIRATVVKNKVATPWGFCDLPFYVVNGYPHPSFERETKIGFDIEEALFDFYVNGNYQLWGTQARVIEQSGGWFCLHVSIDSEQKKWRSREWLEILDKYPYLHDLLYEEETDVSKETTSEVVDAVQETPSE